MDTIDFHPHKIDYCPCCMADPLCHQERVPLDYDSQMCIDCHVFLEQERTFLESGE